MPPQPERAGADVDPARYTAMTVLNAEGARVGLVSCTRCGALVIIDPRDTIDPAAVHDQWHDDLKNRTDPRLFSGQ